MAVDCGHSGGRHWATGLSKMTTFWPETKTLLGTDNVELRLIICRHFFLWDDFVVGLVAVATSASGESTLAPDAPPAGVCSSDSDFALLLLADMFVASDVPSSGGGGLALLSLAKDTSLREASSWLDRSADRTSIIDELAATASDVTDCCWTPGCDSAIPLQYDLCQRQ